MCQAKQTATTTGAGMRGSKVSFIGWEGRLENFSNDSADRALRFQRWVSQEHEQFEQTTW
jgi:hypothetical protein